MHFYPHNIKEFNSATRHLTRVERSVYRDAIELYYDTEQPLTSDLKLLSRKLLARSEEEKEALSAILDEFFYIDGDVYRQDRCDYEIQKYHANNSAKARAGKASAEARRKKKAAQNEQKLTGVEQPLNTSSTEAQQNPTKQETVNSKQEPNKTNDQDKLDQRFEEFWKLFPKDLGAKGSKANARKEFHKLKPPDDLIALMHERLVSQAERKREIKAAGQFAENFKHVERWIKFQQWDDDLPPPPTGEANAVNQQPNQPRRPSAVDRVRLANEERERQRQASAGAGPPVGATDGDLRVHAGAPVRGNDTGELGEVIDGRFTRTN